MKAALCHAALVLALMEPLPAGVAADGLKLGREAHWLVVQGRQIPSREIRINYLEAYCRAGSTDADWLTHTVIPHTNELLSLSADGKVLRLRDTLAEGLVVEHTITAGEDEVDFRLVAHNPTSHRSEAHWAQPCVRLGAFTGFDADPTKGDLNDYLSKCFIFMGGRLTRLPTQPWATQARYVPGQVWGAPGVPRSDLNPRPLSSVVPSNGLIGCFSGDERWIVATAWEPYQELFQGVGRCVHSDFRLGGLRPGQTLAIRGKLYVVTNDIPALLRRYERDFPEQALKHQAGLGDPNLHLLADDSEVQSATNLARILNKPQKYPQPVLGSDQPWEGDRVQAWGSIIQEPDGLLRMWYLALNTERKTNELDRGGYAYAESRDGIRWTKPPLGVVEFRGGKQNNLFYTFAPDGKNLVEEELARRGLGLPALDETGQAIGVVNNADGITVVRDDQEPDPQRRYKLIANMQDHRMWAHYYPDRYPGVTEAQVKQAQAVHGQYLDTSPDGIHWTRKPRRILKCFGDYMMVTRDQRHGQWWLNERIQGHGIRNAALRTSPDLVHWSEPKVFFEDDAENGFGRLFEWHGGMTPFNYGNLDLGFLERWNFAGFGNTCELICSRAPGDWRRVSPGTAYLDIGAEGAFDRTLIFPTHNAPIRVGDKLFIYYTGAGANENTNRGIPMAIGVATITLDRFAGLAHFRGKPGELVTRPLTVSASHLELNAEVLDRPHVRVAISEPDGAILRCYGYDDSQVRVAAGQVYAPVRWRDKPDLSELCGRTVALRFEVSGAVLYSFVFHE